MGTKYSSQATSGYNSSPPVDDGTASEANRVKWATIKTKLADVLKTFGEAINSALVTALDQSCRTVAASDSAAATDHNRTIQVTSSSVTITLADATTMAAGYIVSVANQSSGNITVALATATDTIDGTTNATQTISTKEVRRYIVNAAANGYITCSDRIPFFDSEAIVVGSTDNTKKVRFEVDGLTTGTTRVLTVQDSDDTLVGRATTDTLTNKTLTSPVLNTGVSGTAIAAQADQESASSTSLIVTPGRQHFHPSASKAWWRFDGTGTPSLTASYNVSSITDNGTGDWTVNFSTAFSGASAYTAVGGGNTTSGGSNPVIQFVTFAAGSLRFNMVKRSDGTLDDATIVTGVAFGDI